MNTLGGPTSAAVAQTPAIPGDTQERSVPTAPFRPELNALRGLAVVGLMYHADVPGFGGGFVALEFFFVVSGYLITGQIVKGVLGRKFSFWEFYTRRARRLLPAALCTIFATVVVWTLVLPPFRASEAAREAAWASVSMGNIFFWQHTNYFDVAATSKPLLIMWSLGVEEQWYLFWPLMLVLMLWAFRRRTWIAILAFIVGGVVLTTVVTAHSQAAAYYLAPTRAYDFAIGALCVFIPKLPSRIGIWVMTAGLATMALSVSLFRESFAYPGYLALIPCIGAGLYIASGSDRPRWFLLNPVLQWLGSRSYSIFLLHYPVLATVRYYNNGSLDWTDRMVAFAVMGVLSELQFRYVENRFRIHRAGDRSAQIEHPGPRRFLRLAAPLFALSLFSAFAYSSLHDWLDKPARYPDDLQPVFALSRKDTNAQRNTRHEAICASGHATRDICGTIDPKRPNVLVLGDSLGNDGVNFVAAAEPEANILVAGTNGCPPFRILKGLSYQTQACPSINARRLPQVADLATKVDTIFVASGVSPDRLDGLTDLVSWLTRRGAHVSVLGLGPIYGQYASDVVLAHGRHSAEANLWKALTVSAADNAKAKAAVERAGGSYIDRFASICRDAKCQAFVGDNLLILDSVHMSLPGATWVAGQLGNSQLLP